MSLETNFALYDIRGEAARQQSFGEPVVIG